jgi:glycosyltransferase involved in cell wall biosynthesis
VCLEAAAQFVDDGVGREREHDDGRERPRGVDGQERHWRASRDSVPSHVARVLFTHRYSMRQVERAIEEGSYPAHHLWGADALRAAGHAVELGRFGSGRRSLTALSWRLRRVGDLEQEAVLGWRARGGAVVFAGEAEIVRGLAALGRWPLVGVVHSRAEAWMRRLDVALCLSSRVRDRLLALGCDPVTTRVAAWGPDLTYQHYTPTGDDLVVCAGQTERDPATLLAALRGTGIAAKVYVAAERAPAADGPVEVVATQVPGAPPIHYGGALVDLRRASVVAIPLASTEHVLALSEIGDALALAKPIVMTRTGAIDFDPEAVGCGVSVAPGDIAGWRKALVRLAGNPDLRARLGRHGREWAERNHNADRFRAAVVDAVELLTS